MVLTTNSFQCHAVVPCGGITRKTRAQTRPRMQARIVKAHDNPGKRPVRKPVGHALNKSTWPYEATRFSSSRIRFPKFCDRNIWGSLMWITGRTNGDIHACRHQASALKTANKSADKMAAAGRVVTQAEPIVTRCARRTSRRCLISSCDGNLRRRSPLCSFSSVPASV